MSPFLAVSNPYTVSGCKVTVLHTLHTLAVPSGKVLRQGLRSPKVETRFV
jgi:hypothetical protein